MDNMTFIHYLSLYLNSIFDLINDHNLTTMNIDNYPLKILLRFLVNIYAKKLLCVIYQNDRHFAAKNLSII